MQLSKSSATRVLQPPSGVKSTKSNNKSLESLNQELRDAEERKRLLLSELKQIDYRVKKIREEERLARKALQEIPEDTVEKTRKAIELVKKMNEDRKHREERKLREAMEIRKQVAESVTNMRQLKMAEES